MSLAVAGDDPAYSAATAGGIRSKNPWWVLHDPSVPTVEPSARTYSREKSMKKLVVVAFASLALAQLGTGCIIVSDDDPDPVIDSGEIDVTWNLLAGDLEDNPTGATCPPGGTIEIVAEDQIDTTAVFANMFDCSLGRGVVTALPFSDYVVHLNLYAGPVAPENLIGRSDDRVFTIDDINFALEFDYTMTVDHGRVFFTWTITDNGAAINCATAGGQDVELRSVLSGVMRNDLFDCVAGEGETRFLPLNDVRVERYALSLSLLDALDPPTVLSRAEAIDTDIAVAHRAVDIGDIELILGDIAQAP